MLFLVEGRTSIKDALKPNYLPNFFLYAAATIDVPTNVADQYSHRLPITWDIKAGAKERAGFMEAPEIKPKKSMSRTTIPPTAIPPKPLKPFLRTTTNMTAISRAEASTSVPNTKGKG